MHRISRYGFLFLAMMALVAMAGCSDDDNPTSPTVPTDLVGSWEQVYTDPDYYYMMTLRNDGTGSYVAKYQGVVTNEGDFTYSATQDKSNGSITIDLGDGDVHSGYYLIDEYDWLAIDFGEGDAVQFKRVVDPEDEGIAGTWNITTTVVESTCGGYPGQTENHCVTITRNADAVTLYVGDEVLSGTMINSTTAYFDLSGNGCTVSLTLTVNQSGTQLTGSNPVDCPSTEMTEGCYENSTIVGTRNTGGC